MSTKETVKAQIQSLINKANETTGNTDTNLTDGVNALVSGYGQGGSGSGSDLPKAEETSFPLVKYYYNGVLLPEIPADILAEYPYCWIRNNNSGYYELILGKGSWYYSSDIMYCTDSTGGLQWYRIEKSSVDSATEWVFNQTWTSGNTFGCDANRPCLWSNHNIPNGSATSTTIYSEEIELVPEKDDFQYSIQNYTMQLFVHEARRISRGTYPMSIEDLLKIFMGIATGSYIDPNDSSLYRFYGVNQTEYPYMFIRYYKNTIGVSAEKFEICFGKTKNDNGLSDVLMSSMSLSLSGNTDTSNSSKMSELAMQHLTNLTSSTSVEFYDISYYTFEYYYANFDHTFTNATLYRL